MKNTELKTLIMTGDATEELQRLYAGGWRLVTTANPFAFAVSESRIFGNDNSRDMFYVYAVQYFLERETSLK